MDLSVGRHFSDPVIWIVSPCSKIACVTELLLLLHRFVESTVAEPVANIRLVDHLRPCMEQVLQQPNLLRLAEDLLQIRLASSKRTQLVIEFLDSRDHLEVFV